MPVITVTLEVEAGVLVASLRPASATEQDPSQKIKRTGDIA